ncbi:hypothetical protein CgunFtcFv8_020086 [Champsocephalus gunnari]|uniref:Uncharacterized protein n=1 Tax=Champsocephalus gunnari TaxID=52237 RepID=A0AAN8DGN4_CHAGU|nr:hypothetical protein CgunFtcFv8_020086 [Champsocephalus gunnari]
MSLCKHSGEAQQSWSFSHIVFLLTQHSLTVERKRIVPQQKHYLLPRPAKVEISIANMNFAHKALGGIPSSSAKPPPAGDKDTALQSSAGPLHS